MAKFFILLLTLLFSPVGAAAPAPTLTVTSPAPYQVFQRVNGVADIQVTGYVANLSSYVVEASLDGINWSILTSSNVPFFNAVLTGIPQGQYTVSIRAGGVQRSITFVGVGDVFVIGGQSNASGRIVQRQVYTHPTLKAGLFANSYAWGELKDFTDSIANQRDAISAGDNGVGSIWPLVATHFMADQGVPVAFVPCAKGGSSITQWQPVYPLSQATLYGSCINRIRTVGGVKAILWIQGETDAGTYMSADFYADYLGRVADAFQADAGVSMVVAQLHYLTAVKVPPAAQAQIRQGIFQADAINPNIITGPDLSVIRATDAAGQHFTTVATAQLAASLWWNALKDAFYD